VKSVLHTPISTTSSMFLIISTEKRKHHFSKVLNSASSYIQVRWFHRILTDTLTPSYIRDGLINKYIRYVHSKSDKLIPYLLGLKVEITAKQNISAKQSGLFKI